MEQARTREAALRAEHATEVARLANALRNQEEAHAAEVERLRAEYAAELRRLMEAHWRARDAARTGAGHRTGDLVEGAGPGPDARPPGIRRCLARITRCG